jgi:opacity protein-like surface antigen
MWCVLKRFTSKTQSILALFTLLLATATVHAAAQVVPSAYAKGISVTAGGEASAFQPDYAGFGVPQTSTNRLYGIGAFVDVKFTPWIQIEGEGRWLRFNQIDGIYEDNYLIGPRLPIYKLRFWRATPYGKVLFGYGRLNFEDGNGWGRYTTISFGGGLDIKATKRINIRLPDFEFQQWPSFSEGGAKTYNLAPYGVSAGVSYRVLGAR